jgi:hypothetical protein
LDPRLDRGRERIMELQEAGHSRLDDVDPVIERSDLGAQNVLDLERQAGPWAVVCQ